MKSIVRMFKNKPLAILLIAVISFFTTLFLDSHLLWAFSSQTTTISQNETPIEKPIDAVITWNSITLDIIRTEKIAAPIAARNLAILHAAIYDTVNAITKTYQPYRINIEAPVGTSKEAAVAATAHRVLVSLYPQQTVNLDNLFATSEAEILDSQPKIDGIQLGESIADQILAWRENDGANATVSYTVMKKPGYWQPIPPEFKPAFLPQWKDVKPFAMTSDTQFRINNIPTLTSPEYTAEFNQSKVIGAKNSQKRTAEQTAIASFWSDEEGTFTPVGHWNAIAANQAVTHKKSLEENARLFAFLNIALADATIVESDQQYTFNRWRPITAIHQGNADNNPQTIVNSNWIPLLTTPSSPSYVSGYSTLAGAADVILTAFFGSVINLTISPDISVNLPSRTYTSFRQAAEEAGMSRIYGGVNWLSDNRDGLIVGRNLGQYVIRNFLQSLPTG